MIGPNGGKLICPFQACGSDQIERAMYSFATTCYDYKFFCRVCKNVFDVPLEEIKKIQ